MADPRKVAILISGRGSNMRALVDNARDYEVVLVASNKPHAEGLDWARARGLPTWTWDGKSVAREEFDRVLGDVIDDHGAGSIALAGYMRILSPAFVQRFAGRIVNVHPSLLPKYKGLDTHARVLAAGDEVSGCTVHLVTEELDDGQIVGQAEVAVEAGDTPQSLAQRVLAAEHKLYPEMLAEVHTPMTKPETEAQARRRRWITFGETVAVLALIISALGLYNSWQNNKSGPTEVVEKKQAIPLVLRGEVEGGGKSIKLTPVEDSHALESATVTLRNGKTLELGGNGELGSRDLAKALDKDIERKGEQTVRAKITADYVEAGSDRQSIRNYVIRYRWEGGGFLDDSELRFTGLSRG